MSAERRVADAVAAVRARRERCGNDDLAEFAVYYLLAAEGLSDSELGAVTRAVLSELITGGGL